MADKQGELNKLRIEAYSTPDYQSGSKVDTFEAYVNPSEITISYDVRYNRTQSPGTTNSRMGFNAVKPSGLVLTFFIDGTGANGRKVDVQREIAFFQKVTGYNGDEHRPNYLMIAWGTMEVRRSVLGSASIAYKLFSSSGVPLRAVITATFIDNADDQTRIAKAKDKSPDLMHVRIVKAGDNLPALCYKIYGDPAYYLDVARANRIDNFRDIAPGTRIFFPPLEK